MVRAPQYTLVYDEDFARQLSYVPKRCLSLIEHEILEHLQFLPTQDSKNNKALRIPNSVFATRELRIGDKNEFRVFYVVEESLKEVQILAIGIKIRNILTIGGQEVVL